MLLIFALALLFILGFNITLFLIKYLPILERLALSFVIGLGLVTQVLFMFDLLNINYSSSRVAVILTIADVILSLFIGKKMSYKNIFVNIVDEFKILINIFVNNLLLFEKIILVLILILSLVIFIRAIFWPVYYWDALALYDYRAKIFFDAKGIVDSVKISSLPLHTYPPMTSLAHTFIYLFAGKTSNPQFIYPLFYLSLLITFYYSVRKYSKRWAALLFTFLLADIPFFVEFGANAYTNLPYAFYFGIGTIYLYRFVREKIYGLLIISGILLGLAGWTRAPTEQFFVINLFVLSIYCLYIRKHMRTVILLVFPWKLFVYFVLKGPLVFTEISDATHFGITSALNGERFIAVLKLLFSSTFQISGTALLLAAITAIFYSASVKKNIFLFMIIILNVMVFVVGSYYLSLTWFSWENSITNSANRLSMYLTPFVLYFTAISIPNFLNTEKNK